MNTAPARLEHYHKTHSQSITIGNEEYTAQYTIYHDSGLTELARTLRTAYQKSRLNKDADKDDIVRTLLSEASDIARTVNCQNTLSPIRNTIPETIYLYNIAIPVEDKHALIETLLDAFAVQQAGRRILRLFLKSDSTQQTANDCLRDALTQTERPQSPHRDITQLPPSCPAPTELQNQLEQNGFTGLIWKDLYALYVCVSPAIQNALTDSRFS